MNRPPEIIVNSGFVTDANGVLTEMVIPNNVVTMNIPSIITTYATTINWIPSTTAALVEFNAPGLIAMQGGVGFKGYTKLSKFTASKLTSITNLTGANGYFYGCTGLTTVDMPALITIEDNAGGTQNSGGLFWGCTGLVTLNLPSLTTIKHSTGSGSGNGTFYNCIGLTTIDLPSMRLLEDSVTYGGNQGIFYGCTGLTTINLPKLERIITSNTGGTFWKCTNLTDVTLGSVGSPVTAIGTNAFKECTQTGLTITIYTSGGASLSGEPWGATNATIEYEEA